MKPRVELVSASAGTGKTYTIVARLLDRLLPPDGSPGLAPDSVVVTTFTRDAAAELRERVSQELFRRGRADLVPMLDGALIGTLDSICAELVARFALKHGWPTRPGILGETDRARAVAEAVANSLTADQLDRITALETAFGVNEEAEFPNRRRARPWHQIVARILDQARQNLLGSEGLERSKARTLELLGAFLPGSPVDAGTADRALADALEAAVGAIRPAKAGKFPAYYDELREQLEQARAGSLRWSDWIQLASVHHARRYEPVFEPLRRAASRHLGHPRLKEELVACIRALFDVAAQGLALYDRWSLERGFADFTSLETMALDLLRQPDVAEELGRKIQLVLVDEFQDTSPLQLALFLELARIAKRSIWVGDPKQAIYGFRGADPGLMQGVFRELDPPKGENLLSVSRRSRKELVSLVSELFAPAFVPGIPAEQVRLVCPPEGDGRPEGLGPPVLHWTLQGATCAADVASALARGVRRLLGRDEGEGAMVHDKSLRTIRRATEADIAILCRNGTRRDWIASALEEAGVRASAARSRLLATPEVTLALACLRLILDRGDTLAVAEILMLTSGGPDKRPALIVERLAALARGEPDETWGEDNPAIAAVDRLRPRLAVLSPSEMLDRVLDAVQAQRLVIAWGQDETRLANLEVLRGLAVRYEASCARMRAGASVTGFLHWLEEVESTDVDRQGAGAPGASVEVCTLHAAKGREWPIVVLAELDAPIETDIWSVQTCAREGPIDFEDPLADRWIRYWPWPYGTCKPDAVVQQRLGEFPPHASWEAEARSEALRLLYVAMTRARDVLVIPSWPRAGYLRTSSPETWLGMLSPEGGPDRWPLPSDAGTREVPVGDSGVRCTVLTEGFAPGGGGSGGRSPARWFVPGAPAEAAAGPGALSVTEIAMPQECEIVLGRPFPIGERLEFRGAPRIERPLGDAVHGFFAADDPSWPRNRRVEIARGLLARHCRGVETPVDPGALIDRADRLAAELRGRHGEGRKLVEWPIELWHDGTVLRGRFDLAIETAAGWVLVDHKAYPGRRDSWILEARRHVPQLAAYALALHEATGRPVAAGYIHFVIGGGLVPVPLSDLEALRALLSRCLRGSQAYK